MFVFRKIWRDLFSWNTRFEIRSFALLPATWKFRLWKDSYSVSTTQFKLQILIAKYKGTPAEKNKNKNKNKNSSYMGNFPLQNLLHLLPAPVSSVWELSRSPLNSSRGAHYNYPYKKRVMNQSSISQYQIMLHGALHILQEVKTSSPNSVSSGLKSMDY